jgi:biopolymer transport protein ExbD
MRIQKKQSQGIFEADITPMIDMTFQLIAFFMVLINFSQTEQNQLIQLPLSELAKPPRTPLDFPITLHLTKSGSVFAGGMEMSVDGIRPYLTQEYRARLDSGMAGEDIPVIIRAHKDAETGQVQRLISRCQDAGLQNFKLRAKEEVVGNT